MTAADTAVTLVREVEGLGGRIVLHARGVRVEPPSLLTDDLTKRLRATGRELRALLHERLMSQKAADCELRRFPDFDPTRVFRFCCEQTHAHLDGVPTFFAGEIDLLLAWADREDAHRAPVPLRDLVLEIKSTFGGRIVSHASITPAVRSAEFRRRGAAP